MRIVAARFSPAAHGVANFDAAPKRGGIGFPTVAAAVFYPVAGTKSTAVGLLNVGAELFLSGIEAVSIAADPF